MENASDCLGDSLDQQTPVARCFDFLGRQWQSFIDHTVLYVKSRWFVILGLLVFFIFRVNRLQGFYISAYALGLHLLNILIYFISPKIDSETDQFVLPVHDTDGEFRPFQRQLPEIKCWTSSFIASSIACFTTFFSIFDIPVFWPLLLLYFIVIFLVTMKDQIKQMIRYRYLPFTWGKQSYKATTQKLVGKAFNDKDSPMHMQIPSQSSPTNRFKSISGSLRHVGPVNAGHTVGINARPTSMHPPNVAMQSSPMPKIFDQSNKRPNILNSSLQPLNHSFAKSDRHLDPVMKSY